MQNRSRNALLQLSFARFSCARLLAGYKVWDGASLKRRYVEADCPVVAEHGRRCLKKVCCGRKDVFEEGAETR